MEPITRRQALLLGACGAAGVVVGGLGLSSTGLPWTSPDATPSGPLAEPSSLRSRGGVLRTELVAAEHENEIAGRRALVLGYNGSVPASTWRVRPGDRIEVRLENRLREPTNLHTHGLHVSPTGNGDNPLISLAPGEVFDYRFDLPPDHPSGVFWYHPHHHGNVADQIFGGLFGAIVVEGDALPVARERVLVISDISFAGGAVAAASEADRMMGREGDFLMVNGQLLPEIVARPRERERWRIVNACTARYLRLALPGQRLELLGIDSGHEPRPRAVDEVLLAPGNRADLLVTMQAGSAQLRTLGYDRGAAMMGGMMAGGGSSSGPALLAFVEVRGPDAAVLPAVPPRAPDADLRSRTPDALREISFTMTMGMGMPQQGGMMALGFDGRAFDAGRIDLRVGAETVEEWTIRNPTPMDHPFHLHVWPMQLIQVNGSAIDGTQWRDVVNVPAQGSVVVRIDFARFTGLTVYHCHILDHEDLGMMGTVKAA
ncbi:multicopper oxidase family protein [Microbacterium oleivorans]|uniref:Multicopper oxidase family protein n=1 Tax=Microbacterium binotii TaxID=462710 RepID=A0ABP6BNP2_9MICO|nr:multicopper oxidase family protein [Microbacterium sp. oral taxon 186]EPD83163.1 hypothetical protein HMPREF1529_02531 [Microbacterium sp. oral taxon 186 str. F0373]